MTEKLSYLEKKFLECLSSFPLDEGATLSQLQPQLEGVDIESISRVINVLSKKSHLDVQRKGSIIVYKIIKPKQKETVQELEKEEKIVYSLIKQVGSEGVWIKSLAVRSNLHQNTLNKALKKLEQRLLIKQVKGVKQGNKKLYMLFELEPSADLTGGVWFTDQELDIDFVETVSKLCLRFISLNSFHSDPMTVYPVNYNGYPTLFKITQHIRAAKISNVVLEETDVKAVLDTLEFDGKIERLHIPAEPLLMLDDDTDQYMYRCSKSTRFPSAVVPCTGCSVSTECSEFGSVNPLSCEYLNSFLSF